MPLRNLAADALGVVTISLVAVFVFLGLVCILYSLYFRSRTRRQGFGQLSYFAGPWVIRVIFISFAIWWGFGEIVRLSFWREEGVLNTLNLKWQEISCKCYIVSNLGFAEPCLFLTLLFLLRASLQTTECRILSHQWNGKTACYVLLCCIPVFFLQLTVILIGPELSKHSHDSKWPLYFTNAFRVVQTDNDKGFALCTYPLLNTILLGLFATVLTSYLAWLGRKILKLVINKCLKKRVYTLIVSVSTLLPLRVLLVGLSVLLKPEQSLFEALAFLAFLSLLFCLGICIVVLVYLPCADSLALGNIGDLEACRMVEDQNDTVSLIATNRSHPEEDAGDSSGQDSGSSSKRGSISFRTFNRDGTSMGTFVELSLFSPSRDDTPPGSPPVLGWPMRSPPPLPPLRPQPSDP